MIRASDNQEGVNIGTRLDVSARHVVVARLGADLHADPRTLAEIASEGVVQTTVAPLMVYGSGQTSIDLCASALLLWHGDLPKRTPGHDFGDLRWRVARDEPKVKLTKGQQDWFDAIDGSPL